MTPGPRQPKDWESFLYPIAEELNSLAAGVSGVEEARSPTTPVLQAFILQFTTDMPAGDELLNTTCHNGARPNSYRDFTGVFHGTYYYFPPVDPHTGRTLFNVRVLPMVSRTTASLAASAPAVA